MNQINVVKFHYLICQSIKHVFTQYRSLHLKHKSRIRYANFYNLHYLI